MTVCVFDPQTNYCIVDNVAMRSGVYSNKMKKIYQVAAGDYIFTIMTAGSATAIAFALPHIVEELKGGDIDAVSLQQQYKALVDDTLSSPFQITVVEYHIQTRNRKCFCYDSTFVPYEITWAPYELVIAANLEIEVALQALYAWEVVKGNVPLSTVCKMIGRLVGIHSVYPANNELTAVKITEFDEGHIYVDHRKRIRDFDEINQPVCDP